MDIKDLKYFLAIAQEGTITRAAEKLCIAQPPLSRQMKLLEAELGVSLFKRGKRHIVLTEEGLYLKQQAKDIVYMMEQTGAQLRQIKNDTIGTVSIGVTEASGTGALSQFITPFHNKYPNIQFNIWCSNGDEIKDKLEKGLVDIGIVREPLDVAKYNCTIYKKEAWGAIISTKHPLDSITSDTIELSNLSGESLIIPSRTPLQEEIISWFQKQNLEHNVICMYNILSCVIPLVTNNTGIAICPESAKHFTNNQELIYRRISHPERLSNILFIRNRDYMLSAGTNCFWEFVQSQLPGRIET